MPVLSERVQAFEGYKPNRVLSDTVREFGHSFTEVSDVKTANVELASSIADEYPAIRDESRVVYDGYASVFEFEALDSDVPINYGHVRPVLKMIDVFDASLGINLPNYSLLAIWYKGATLTTFGGLLGAVRAVGETALALSTASEESQTPVSDQLHLDFTTACLAFLVELVFIYVPVNFSVAWRGTRWASNRVLYRLRTLPAGNRLLALTMSTLHWILRGAPEELSSFVLDTETIFFIRDQLNTMVNIVTDAEPFTSDEIITGFSEMVSEEFDESVPTELLAAVDL